MSSNSSPACIKDLEEFAKKTLPRNAYDYYSSGADDQQTLQENVSAYKRSVLGAICSMSATLLLPIMSYFWQPNKHFSCEMPRPNLFHLLEVTRKYLHKMYSTIQCCSNMI